MKLFIIFTLLFLAACSSVELSKEEQAERAKAQQVKRQFHHNDK